MSTGGGSTAKKPRRLVPSLVQAVTPAGAGGHFSHCCQFLTWTPRMHFCFAGEAAAAAIEAPVEHYSTQQEAPPSNATMAAAAGTAPPLLLSGNVGATNG